MKNFIFFSLVIFVFSASKATDPADSIVATVNDSQSVSLNSCVNNIDPTTCTNVFNRAVNYFEIAKNAAITSQTATCQSKVNEFNGECNSTLFNNIKMNLEDIKSTIDSKMVQFNSLSRFIQVENQMGNDIQSMIKKLEDLKAEIEAAQVFITAQKNDLDDLNKTCESGVEEMRQVCTPPTVNSDGLTTRIVEINLETPEIRTVQKAQASVNGDTVAAVVAMNGELEAPAIDQTRSATETQYATTSRVGGVAYGTAQETDGYATASITQINNIISSISQLTPGYSNPTCNPRIQACPPAEEPPAGAPIDPIVVTPLDPVEGGGGPGDGGRGTGTGTGGRGTASAEELGDEALGGSYGADSSGIGDTSNKTTGAATNPNGGGLAGALSGLSGMFGKTSGGFGDSSSYGSNYGSARYGSNKSGGTNYNKNSGSYYNNASNPAFKSVGGIPQAQGQNRGFQPQFNAGGSPAAGIGQGQAGSGLSGFDSSGSGGPSNEDSKPGLLSRLFGKKDKNMFGKTTGSGGGGSIPGANSKTGIRGASGSSYDSTDPSNPNNPTGRTFDPNKYMPSKEAEERAYLRSTGRKMASRGLASAAHFQWPDDISRNKNLNLFKTVNLIHRAKLAQ